MGVVEPDRFLTEVKKMYERSKEKGSVWLTFKRSDVPSKPCKGKRPLGDPSSYKCLVRATDGKKKTVSTSVAGAQQTKFQESLMLIIKAHADALKKREKARKDGGKAEEATGKK